MLLFRRKCQISLNMGYVSRVVVTLCYISSDDVDGHIHLVISDSGSVHMI